ncbi:MAG: hypothetical protein COV72_02780 [Candidatus Omnitrophica bacterium CG11_big_fil_rev_8_21_14_0_20_42_13]|uniref:Uncharacterized protein n=1 Tax=Candidatus Ghiorseimicrobium undicola TaxID=1974746 RepID=A0A2H0M192_9BACT|nr:MAG: hypothetical protein COV72_02780 [Candidatus Omnitrophica bacterium CG11_big_fil_rev_8_21_14_0_20_42_13]
MKISRFFLLFLSMLVFVSYSYAAGVGNPIKPLGNMKFAVAGEANFNYGRDMDANGESTSGNSVNSLELAEISQGYVKLILGLSDFANIFAKVGTAKINGLDIKFFSGEGITIESGGDFLYGFGGSLFYRLSREEMYFMDKYLNWYSDFDFFAGLNLDASFFNPDADEMTVAGESAANVSGELKTREFQVSIFSGIEFHVDENLSIVPYVNAFWNGLSLDTDGVRYDFDILNFDTNAQDEFGAGVGLEVNLSENISFNIEGRFLGGNSVSFGATGKF